MNKGKISVLVLSKCLSRKPNAGLIIINHHLDKHISITVVILYSISKSMIVRWCKDVMSNVKHLTTRNWMLQNNQCYN